MKNPEIADKKPTLLDLEKGKNHAWCSCGKSDGQPWCDGSHKGSDFEPLIFSANEQKKHAICLCKHTKNPPYCDGSHMNL